MHRDRGDWGEVTRKQRLLHVPADCPGVKRTMSEGHFSHATFATSGFIETANIIVFDCMAMLQVQLSLFLNHLY